MLALIPLLPFAGFVINAFFGRRLPKSVSGGIACLVMLAAFGVSVAAIGRSIFTEYAFPFEATSILILAAMVGAVVLARREQS